MLSFSRALERCEILFFSALSISAYLESGQWVFWAGRFGRILAFCLRTRILGPSLQIMSFDIDGKETAGNIPNFVGPLAGTILPWAVLDLGSGKGDRTYVCPALEDDGFMAWALAVRKRTYGLGGLIWESSKQIIESLVAKRL